jgi:hypothetical protein
MNLDDLQTQVSEATKRLSQRFSQAEVERPPKKPPTVESFVTELSPGPIIREVSPGGASSTSTGQQPPPPDPGPGGGTIACAFSETVTGAVNGVPATLEVCTPDATGWVTI